MREPDMTDYRIEAASKEEWAERALRAEAKLAKAMRVVEMICGSDWEERLGEAIDIGCEILSDEAP